MVKPPKDGESLTKAVNNKTYHWCSNQKAWVKDSPKQCHMKAKDRKQRQGKSKASKETKKKVKGAGLSFASDFAAIMADAVRDKQSSDSIRCQVG
eukprot:5234111-Ditylum_brightwellii.AAC.2